MNCRAVMQLSLHFGKRLAERGRGGLILFGSLVGYQGTPHAAHYAATKAYVQTLAEHCTWNLRQVVWTFCTPHRDQLPVILALKPGCKWARRKNPRLSL